MKPLQGLAAALLSLLISVPALAQDAVADRVKAELRKKMAETPVDSVRKIPYGNLYEVTVGS